MTAFPHIQSDPCWFTVVGPDIAPNPEDIQLTRSPLWVPDGLLLTITGLAGKYSGAVARSADYSMPPDARNSVLTVSLAVDEAFLAFAQSLELGWKYTLPNGITLNDQIQFDFAHSPAGMMTLDLTSVGGSGWNPTKKVLPKFAPNVIHTVAITSKWTDSDISVISVETDGEVYTPTPDEVPCKGKSLGWGKGKFQVNLQPNTNQKGGRWMLMIYSVSMAVS